VRLRSGLPLEGEAIMRGSDEYLFGLTLPHYLFRRNRTAQLIVPADYLLETGDVLEDEYGGEKIITEVFERRKARGDWRGNPFDSAPDWVEVEIL